MSELEYKCAMCEEEFISDNPDWTEEDKWKEHDFFWGNVPRELAVKVCEDCFQKVNPIANPEIYNRSLAQHEFEKGSVVEVVEDE